MMNFGIGIFIIFNVGKQSLARLDPVFQKIIYEKLREKFDLLSNSEVISKNHYPNLKIQWSSDDSEKDVRKTKKPRFLNSMINFDMVCKIMNHSCI
jgi:hypothetical protein